MKIDSIKRNELVRFTFLPDPENLEEDTQKFMAAMKAVQEHFSGKKVKVQEILDFLEDFEN